MSYAQGLIRRWKDFLKKKKLNLLSHRSINPGLLANWPTHGGPAWICTRVLPRKIKEKKHEL